MYKINNRGGVMKGNLVAYSMLCGSLLGAALPVMGAGNGITKEDIKRLQVNAFAQEMQLEMEKSAFSELESSIADPELNAEKAYHHCPVTGANGHPPAIYWAYRVG